MSNKNLEQILLQRLDESFNRVVKTELAERKLSEMPGRMQPLRKQYVFAQTYEQFKFWRQYYRVRPEDCVYVASPERLHGVDAKQVVIVTTGLPSEVYTLCHDHIQTLLARGALQRHDPT